VRALRRWWANRSLRVRITLVVGLVALAVLLALSRFGAGLLYGTLLGAADAELRGQAERVATRLEAGVPVADAAAPPIRVVDVAGAPADGGGPLPLRGPEVRRLAAGEPVTTYGEAEQRRWLAVPAILPDGSTRLVVATADLVGGATLLRRAAAGFLLAALLAAAVLALAAWAATRAALRPVDRLRAAAAALPPGERLPLPAARDELRALAEEMNSLLARRDEAVARLERFTGDAAHELRSPVAAIRAQAEVATSHPDPELAGETLQAVAVEAARLTDLLSALLALARADAGQRPAARPVDLVAAVREAIERARPGGSNGDGRAGPRGSGRAGSRGSGGAGSRGSGGEGRLGSVGSAEFGGERRAGSVGGEGRLGSVGSGGPGGGGHVGSVGGAGRAGPVGSGVGDRPGSVGSGGERRDDAPVLQLVAPTPALVAASPVEVGLVLDNLIANASRYARSVVRISVLPAGRWVRLVVEDDGPGIPEADRGRVFDRFTRLAPEVAAPEVAAPQAAPEVAAPEVAPQVAPSGSGLGLALVAALVRGRGGAVTAGESAAGGARLEVRWPAAG
jgi:two-component system OmpR family sensor kinase